MQFCLVSVVALVVIIELELKFLQLVFFEKICI